MCISFALQCPLAVLGDFDGEVERDLCVVFPASEVWLKSADALTMSNCFTWRISADVAVPAVLAASSLHAINDHGTVTYLMPYTPAHPTVRA